MKELGPEDQAFRKLVSSLDGHQNDIAEALGITRVAVARRLAAEKHHAWWMDFKSKRARKRRQRRNHRAYERKKRKFKEANTLLAGTAEAERLLLKAILDEL